MAISKDAAKLSGSLRLVRFVACANMGLEPAVGAVAQLP